MGESIAQRPCSFFVSKFTLPMRSRAPCETWSGNLRSTLLMRLYVALCPCVQQTSKWAVETWTPGRFVSKAVYHVVESTQSDVAFLCCPILRLRRADCRPRIRSIGLPGSTSPPAPRRVSCFNVKLGRCSAVSIIMSSVYSLYHSLYVPYRRGHGPRSFRAANSQESRTVSYACRRIASDYMSPTDTFQNPPEVLLYDATKKESAVY